MSNRLKQWVVIFFFALISIIYWGCTQPSDVLVPISSSEVTLAPQLLPSNFPGMHYELWVANATDSASFGKFGYDSQTKQFLETSGAVRANGNRFNLDDNIYRFTKIFVSVEENADPDPSSPGPIMLIDDVTIPSNASVDLVFPLDELLWEATSRYNMETTSDSDIGGYNFDGYGLWFASYQRLNDSIQDTLSLDSFWLDSIYEEFSRDTNIVNLIGIADVNDIDSTPIFSVNSSIDTTRFFGVDSYTHKVVRYNRIVQYDSADAGDSILITIPSFDYSVGLMRRFVYDEFTQDSFALPDYTSYGWKYKGWVVSPYVNSALVGNITPPAWSTNTFSDSLIPGINGGLLTTGTFSRINNPDDTNPYAQSNRLPQFPGEDFLLFPSSWIGAGGLVPNGSGNSGTVFITLEPNNFVTDTTNFPLIAFTAHVPNSRADITGDEVIINMRNRTQTVDPRIGFPRIRVNITTF